MTVLKICGITNTMDRDSCMKEGVELLGFNIYEKSERYVDPKRLDELIIPEISKKAVIVGVDFSYHQWLGVINRYRPGYIQLHGEEDMDTVRKIKNKFSGVKIIKMVTIQMENEFSGWFNFADFLLCDTKTEAYGGSGKKFDWRRILNLNEEVRKRLFIAGGINPDNIDELLKYKIFGIDVASGSEIYPGKKDILKIKKLVQKVKNYGT